MTIYTFSTDGTTPGRTRSSLPKKMARNSDGNWSIPTPETAEDFGWHVVTETPQPEIGNNWDGVRRTIVHDGKGFVEQWELIEGKEPLTSRTGIDTFDGAPDKVAVSLGALALRDAAIGQLWKMAMQAIVEAGDDDTALLAALRSLPALYAAAELRGTVAMQIIDNDQTVAEEMMVGRVNAVRVKAEAWVRTEEGQAFVKALTES